jgi:hypothetical protein
MQTNFCIFFEENIGFLMSIKPKTKTGTEVPVEVVMDCK